MKAMQPRVYGEETSIAEGIASILSFWRMIRAALGSAGLYWAALLSIQKWKSHTKTCSIMVQMRYMFTLLPF